jgi:hypothetical protein
LRYRRKAGRAREKYRQVEVGSGAPSGWHDEPEAAAEDGIGYGTGTSGAYGEPGGAEAAVPEPEFERVEAEAPREEDVPDPSSQPSTDRPPTSRAPRRSRPSELSDAADDEPPLPLDEPESIRRTPHMDAPRQFRLKHGNVVDVAVYLDTARLRDIEEGDDVVVDAPDYIASIELGVLLTTSEHFNEADNPYKTLQLDRNSSKSARVTFAIEVVDPHAGDEVGISALFVHAGRPCGRIARRWLVRNGTARAETVLSGKQRGGVGRGGRRPSMYVHAESQKPDLSVFITAPIYDGQQFVCSVQTDLLDQYRTPVSGPWGLPTLASDFVRATLSRFTDPALSPEARKRELKAAGFTFFDAAPQVFKDALWALVDAHTLPRSIFVASIEPSIPWELMIPFRNNDSGEPEEPRQPLGVEFPIGRWVRGDHISAAQDIKVDSSFVVAPDYAAARALDATAELAFLTSKLGGKRVAPASVDSLDKFFAANEASLVHFVCHGTAGADDDAIFLDNDEELRSSVVRALDGFRTLCRNDRPLVFLNSCETGRLVPSLIGGAGFPRSFGDIGARAVIAPLWSVDDKLAHRAAVEIYQRALEQPDATLAEIVRDIRKRGYDSDPFEDTWAAYALYADPLTRLET